MGLRHLSCKNLINNISGEPLPASKAGSEKEKIPDKLILHTR
jgi:hypothetical protein